jgi:D-alanyl-D-alanine carboxypeptidase
MSTIKHRFRPGIHYGAGLMELRFEGFMPLLRGLPRPTGHIGILGTHLFYDADHDAHIALNFGSTGEMVRSVRAMIKVEQLLKSGLRP